MQQMIQCGFPGSGNYVAYRIMRGLQGERYRSFKRAMGLAEVAEAYLPHDWSFPEWPELDEWKVFIDIVESNPIGVAKASALEWFDPDRRLLAIDHRQLQRYSTLVFTHEHADVARDGFPAHGKVYVVRNALDAVASVLHKMATPFMRRINPVFECETVEALVDLPGYVERIARKWRDHVRSYLDGQDLFWDVWRYEFLHDRAMMHDRVYHVGLDPERLPLVLDQVSLEATRKHAPRHVQRKAGHKELGITERVLMVCEQEMRRLGYL